MDKLENTQLQERFARLFSGYTIAGQYARYVEMLTKAQEAQFFEKYEKLVNETKAQDSKAENEIFLSIIIRTQGKRADGLREALLCLEAQTDQDFEVILAAHKAKPHNLKQIKAILKEQTAAMRKKIRLIQIEEGTRAVPINYGFAYARGRYVSVYDDDDILFADYVEAFHQAAEFGEGKLLHAYVFSQKWKENVKSKDQTGYCAVGAPKPQYCQNFHLIRQLEKNLCPLMSIAFPRYLFDECRIMFDESLDVMEDWEYIMRTAPLCGVYDIEEVTSIYRHWMNAENSASIHGQDTWDKVYAQIRSRINGHPLLLQSYLRHFAKIKHFRDPHSYGRAGSFFADFIGFDYSGTRDGAFYKNQLPKEHPLVSIIVRTCQRQAVLRETLLSLRSQTYPNIEIVVVEDGKETAGKMIREEFSDLNILYFATGKRTGRSRAGNMAMEKAHGTYLNFLDDDDLFYADHVEVLVHTLLHSENRAAYAFAFQTPITVKSLEPYVYELEAYEGIHKQTFDKIMLCHHNYIPIQCMMFEKSLFEQYGGLDESLDALEDWDLWVRYSLHTDFTCVEKTTSIYRVPKDRKKRVRRQKVLDDALEIVREKHKGYLQRLRVDEIAGLYQTKS